MGIVSASDTQNRRDISVSSGFVSGNAETVLGSSAIPQIGQLPGPSRTTSGCIGHVHCPAAGAPAGPARRGARTWTWSCRELASDRWS